MSQRTDELEDYAEQKLHKIPVKPQEDIETVQEPYSQPDPMPTKYSPAYKETVSETVKQPNAVPMKYPHIDSLEMTILGETFADDPLKDRVSRMEVKAFGSASTNPDMSQRTDALEAYAEKKLHKRPLPQNNEDDTASSGSPHSPHQGSSGGMENKIPNHRWPDPFKHVTTRCAWRRRVAFIDRSGNGAGTRPQPPPIR